MTKTSGAETSLVLEASAEKFPGGGGGRRPGAGGVKQMFEVVCAKESRDTFKICQIECKLKIYTLSLSVGEKNYNYIHAMIKVFNFRC